MEAKLCWIVLDPSVPEHFINRVGDDYIIEWYFDWEDRTPEKDQEFRDWLNNLPIGQIVYLPDQNGRNRYRIVRCFEPV